VSFARAALLILLPALGIQSQSVESKPEAKAQPGSIEGTVLRDSNGRPLKRAQVVLKPADTAPGRRSYGVTTGDDGQFSFPEVQPGLYQIVVESEGYLTTSIGVLSGVRMPPVFTLYEGQHLTGFTFRLDTWSVIAGQVKFEDAEPAIGVAVQLYREYYFRARHGYRFAGGTRTDDRGEYRVSGLSPGAYYVAATYEQPAILKNTEEPQRVDATGRPQPELRYAVTFYPSTPKMLEATPVPVAKGQEIRSVDIFLTRVPTVRVRGYVTSGLSGGIIANASIDLRSADAGDSGSVQVPVNLTSEKDGAFVLKGVVPGSYIVVAGASEGDKALSARQVIDVSETGIEDLELMAQPAQRWLGRIRLEGDSTISLSQLTVSLEPRRETASPSQAQVTAEGDFALSFLPQETYDLFVQHAPGLYLKEVRIGNANVLDRGLRAEGGPLAPIEVVLSAQGGRISGRILTPANEIARGAYVILIPDPAQGRVQAYQNTFSDEFGQFALAGIPPGRYLLISWLQEAPCEVYRTDDLGDCRRFGVVVDVGNDSQNNVEIRAY
jgi:hypothetical protein